jgi:DNA repair protein SbcD/Mre11
VRFIHTADWHLGRIFHQVHLTEDQAFALEGLLKLVEEHRPDALVLAGDVYDRAVPPPEAVALLDRTLSRLIGDLRVPVVMIPGNHDSAARLGFGARLLRDAGLHVIATLGDALTPVTIGGVEIFGVPYSEPVEVRAAFGDDSVRDHETAMRGVMAKIAERRSGRPAVLAAHAFVQGGAASESERPLAIGNVETVTAEVFASFGYVALGHLHRPQKIGGAVRYSGSLLKYSFSECADAKGVNLVEIDASGVVEVTSLALPAQREVRERSGMLAELLQARRDEAYLKIKLLDEGPVLNAMARLREVFPNVLLVERAFLARTGGEAPAAGRKQVDDLQMIEAFLSHVREGTWNEGERALCQSVLTEMAQPERAAP